VFGIAPAAQAAVNVVPNPGFEQAGCGASTPVVCGWRSDSYGGSLYLDNGSFSSTPHSGASSLYLAWSDDNYTGMGPVGVDAQTDFCAAIGPGAHPASFWYANAGGAGSDVYVSMGATFYQGTDCTGSASSDSLTSLASGSGWQQLSGVLAAPPGTQSALFALNLSTYCAAYQFCGVSANFDDLDVEDTAVTTPAINDFSPTSGPAGTSVDIHGANLTGAIGVQFNGTEASFTVDSDSEIHATVPGGATAGPITVTTPNGTTTSSSSFAVSVPTISSFSPASGPPGTNVTIQGENLSDTTSVTFNGTPAWFYFAPYYGEIIATVPAGATTGTISVTTPTGTATSSSSFMVTNVVPTISSFTPNSGPIGASVDIVGAHLYSLISVTFNGTAAAGWTVNSDTEIHATVPRGATTGPISVTTTSGTGSSSSSFVVIPPPGISALTPAIGPVGTTIDLQGGGFTGATSVTFNGTNASYTVDSDTDIHATVPAGATTGPIVVSTPGGITTSSTPFTVIPPPAINTFTPTSGPAGTTVDLQGGGFTGATSVTFDGTNASYTVDSDTDIHATVPTGATTGPISVSTPGGTDTSSASFTVIPPPAIRAFTPMSGPAGTTIDLQGGGFTGATSVTFNGTNASYTVDSDTDIHATVPAGATTGPISVTTPGGTDTSSASFTIIPPPALSGFSPTSGHAGQQVTISGSNFTGVTAVKLGTTSAKFILNSSTKITAVVPTIAHGYYRWSVTTASGTGTSSASFHVI
jgi:hypothetical protein